MQSDPERSDEAARGGGPRGSPAAPVLLASCDREQRYKFANQPYAEWLGTTPGELAGRTLAEVLGAERYACLRPHVEAALAGQRVEMELDISRPGAGSRTMRFNYEPETDAAGQVTGFLAAILDVTAYQQARQVEDEEDRLAQVVVGPHRRAPRRSAS